MALRIFLLGILAVLAPACRRNPAVQSRPPNIVVIFCDDLGYGDVGCFGSPIPTPHIDQLAREGMRFTQFYAAQAVCSASRAALLTGCYPGRIGIQGALGPGSPVGLHRDESTIAQVLKTRGYATAIQGKWHLGDAPEFLPTRHGFDEWFGLPYSNDMWPNHPTNKKYPPLPLYDGERVVELMPDQSQLTRRYTEKATSFIRRHADRPFFLYLAHNMPHVPIFPSKDFAGRTGLGPYADVVAELDWSVGEVLRTLRENHLDRDTLVVFTSDNGPWSVYGNHAGSTGGLRGTKGTSFEGGVRVPAVAWWPGQIAPGSVCREVAGTIDLLPSVAAIAGASLPPDRAIDGGDLGPLLRGVPGARSPREAQFIYWISHLDAVRSGRWKLHFPHPFLSIVQAGKDGTPGTTTTHQTGLALYDLEADPAESLDVAALNPDVVGRLSALGERMRSELGDSSPIRSGSQLRPVGKSSP
jgi:arylsulfatase A-like enzyme